MRARPRALSTTLISAMLLVASGSACIGKPEANPEWLKPPAAYQPLTADLSFNKERLEQFNSMSREQRDSHVEALKASPGSFKGQAIFKSGGQLGEKMDNAKFGAWELIAAAEAILFEISIEYQVFTTPEIGRGFGPGQAIEFVGTLVESDYADSAKPRKLTLKVQASEVRVLRD